MKKYMGNCNFFRLKTTNFLISINLYDRYQEQEINWRQLLADSFRTPHTQEGRDFSMATEVFDNV
jgi:hypothetical protein